MNMIMDKRVEEELVPNQHPGKLLLTDRQWEDVGNFLNISVRERQVCELLFVGLTRQAIADHLGIKNRTVRHHMEQLHTKLKVSERVGVVLRIVQIRDEIINRSRPSGIEAARSTESATATRYDRS